MEIIPNIYIIIYPVLLVLFRLASGPVKKYSVDLLSGLNMLLCLFALYNGRKLIGVVQLLRTLKMDADPDMPAIGFTSEFVLVQVAKVLLPLFLLIPACRSSMLYAGFLFAFFFNYTAFAGLDLQDVFLSLCYCTSLFSATYALLWLFKKLPSQNNLH